jgi:hypothetical protein
VVNFVARKAFIKKRKARPSLPEPPGIPDQKADPQTLARYESDQRTYLAAKNMVDTWDKDFEHEKATDQWRIDFLSNDDVQDPDARDFAVALLGIDAWLALTPDGRKEEMKKKSEGISLNECVMATLMLQWKWPNNKVTTVSRFEIKRSEMNRSEPKPTRTVPL